MAQRVTGEEEVPEGAVAVLTPDAPDVLSHVSVRARNMRVLFAICHDSEELAKVSQVSCSRVPIGGNRPQATLVTCCHSTLAGWIGGVQVLPARASPEILHEH